MKLFGHRLIKDNPLNIANEMLIMPWYFKMIGFNYKYILKVCDDPIPEGKKWVYNFKVGIIHLRWLKFKIKSYRYSEAYYKYKNSNVI